MQHDVAAPNIGKVQKNVQNNPSVTRLGVLNRFQLARRARRENRQHDITGLGLRIGPCVWVRSRQRQ